MYISGRENQSIFPQQSVGIVLSNKKKTLWIFADNILAILF